MPRAFILVGFALCGLPVHAQTAPFAKNAYPVLQKALCAQCHNADGVASATRLHFPEADASPERIEAFGKSLVALTDTNSPESSLLFKKPTNRVPHTGGERIKRGSSDEAVLLGWVRSLARLSSDEIANAKQYGKEEAAGAGYKRTSVALRRLTNSQYNNTVRDLLGDLTSPATQFPPEDFANGFKNQYQTQNMSPLQVEAYSIAAEKLARNAFRGGDSHGLIPCKQTPSCEAEFLRAFGLRAFRRPLDPEEQRRYQALFRKQSDFLHGAQLVVEAMLQSPVFLFRLEETPKSEWKPYATASRLSYGLWDTMPDTELLESAARGELSTPQGVEKAARRMLADARAREALDEFVSQWLRFDRVMNASKDRRRFPKFNREVAVSMSEEAKQLVSYLVWENRNFMELFTADYAFVNADLAGIYGVPPPARDFDKVRLPPESERTGVLGEALFLTLTAKPEETSPTARGLFVREQFLCQHVADPPPGVNTNLPAVSEAKPETNRDRISAHVTNPTCAGCHNLIDPIGFGFEKFDAIGSRTETLKLLFYPDPHGPHKRDKPKQLDLPLDTTGFVAGIPDAKFSSPRELGAVLARTPQCAECLVKQYFRYSAGRLETPADRPLIQQVYEDFRKSEFRFKEMMISLVRLREFPAPKEDVHVAQR
jgi:Protein of unknown function (DUF1592)/Protein of unknown function (DUF1588)/Protein of unknown function (DUF1587)/Protein of unknown function (DUF1595)/Protein of unknown function (DUF1585)